MMIAVKNQIVILQCNKSTKGVGPIPIKLKTKKNGKNKFSSSKGSTGSIRSISNLQSGKEYLSDNGIYVSRRKFIFQSHKIFRPSCRSLRRGSRILSYISQWYHSLCMGWHKSRHHRSKDMGRMQLAHILRRFCKESNSNNAQKLFGRAGKSHEPSCGRAAITFILSLDGK